MTQPARDYGPKKEVAILLTLDTITRNQCQNVPEISLVYGKDLGRSDAATYVLSSDASALWKFRWPNPVSAKDEAGRASLAFIDVAAVKGNGAIELRLKPGAAKFQGIELLLHFEPRGKKNPGASLVLDPVVKPGGGPRV